MNPRIEEEAETILAIMEPRIGGLLLLLLASLTSAAFSSSRISVNEDGGYEGIVVRVRDDVDEAECADLVHNIEVRSLSARYARKNMVCPFLNVLVLVL